MKNLLLIFLAVPLLAMGQGYPSKPIRFVVPYPPGGGLDLFARPFAQKVTELIGQPVIVENKPGASGVVGAAYVAQQPADGYTLLLAAASQYLQPLVSKNVPFDNARDFTPIISAVNYHNVVVVHPELPVKTVKDLVNYAKSNPGKLAYVTAGQNSSQHLAALLMEHMTGIELLHVSYKGGSPALNDLLGGRVQMGILVQSTVMAHIKSGKLRPVAVVEADRAKALPDVPTVGQSGLEGYAIPESWLGVLGPGGLPKDIVNRFNQAATRAIADAEMKSRVEGLGYEITGSTPEEFQKQIDRTVDIYRRIVTTAGIKPE
ncbi:MAG TPA: tripartite tricarboxylate transporter substrate binding protein [Burkholderiales bacterium]|nr:tripartite tricarboxylate transporter substrate binding protein [Burkholderiales bacterium]